MTDGINPATPPALPTPPARRGCLFYAVLAIVMIGLLALMVIGGGWWMTQRWIKNYTDPSPVLVEKVEYSSAQMQALRRRLDAFQTALDKGETSEELSLSPDDLNALINENRDLKGKLFVRIEDDRVSGQVSLPLPPVNFGPVKLAGRYLNGQAIFQVRLNQGKAQANLEDLRVKNQPVPAVFLNELKKQNLADNFVNEPNIARNLARFESVQITNGQVILRSKTGKR